MKEVVIVEAVRTPVGKRNGLLSRMRPDELLSLVLKELISRSSIDANEVEDVIAGCVTQVGEQANDVARMAALIAGFPIEVPGVTIDRQCGSSQQAIHFASQAIACGDMDVVIAGGVESMSRVPMFSNMKGTSYSERLSEQYEMINQGLSAERIAEKWELTKHDLDDYAVKSHERALVAIKEGRFEKETMPIHVTDENGDPVTMRLDEGPRPGTTLEVLSQLKPAFQKDGLITAGNASQMSDGASAVLLMSREKAESLGLQPRFRIVARSVVGSDPTLMLTGPVAATYKSLQKAGLGMGEIDLFEVNEAFAPVPLFWMKETGVDHSKLNVNGGAIALGHPLGATGAKLMITLMHELERTGKRYGLQAVCEGLGMANATVIERLEAN
ncbi:thiolase family protein [Halobacillus sp. BBL2006]|uniref:thiolase family protein n=1 Tax=Halobacillus sp. BBL2006 TaxID=1543706 RepID=UPI0005428329|nr:thiolase family protein [Halobacillus sp. BBL2006]KHE70821.1 acetyl-CoA acetyltransferase [Halobacillus sp. BBL2006]